MPSTFISLAIFVIFLTPGLLFTLRQEWGHGPLRRRSAFRELAEILLGGLAADLLVGVAFGVLRLVTGQHTPDVGRLIRQPRPYFLDDYAYLLTWAAVLWLLACVLAYLFAAVSWSRLRIVTRTVGRVDFLVRLVRSESGRRPVSAWWQAFEVGGAGVRKRVMCRLDDGTHIEGDAWTYNPGNDEVDDRSFTLTGPLVVVEPGAEPMRTDLGTLVVSARRLQYLYVRYLPK